MPLFYVYAEKYFCHVQNSILVQFSSVTQSCPTLCDPMDCSTPDLPVHHQLAEFTQTYVHWVGDAIQPFHPLSSPLLLPSVFPSIRVFFSESVLRIRWPKYWSFGFNISPSNEHSGLISFRMDWLDLLAVQGTAKSLLQHHSSKASIFWHSAFFTVQLSYPYMTTGKTIALTRWTFVGRVLSLLFNKLSRLVVCWQHNPVVSGCRYPCWGARCSSHRFSFGTVGFSPSPALSCSYDFLIVFGFQNLEIFTKSVFIIIYLFLCLFWLCFLVPLESTAWYFSPTVENFLPLSPKALLLPLLWFFPFESPAAC